MSAATSSENRRLRTQAPFLHGGAEILSERLVEELRRRKHEADLVAIPYKWYPGTRVLSQALLWRLVDLTESDGRPIDLGIATKFPSYAVRHPNADDGELRAEMWRRAVEYVKREHDLPWVAEPYCAALEEGAGRSLVQDTGVSEVGKATAGVGLVENDRELREVASALREVGLGD